MYQKCIFWKTRRQQIFHFSEYNECANNGPCLVVFFYWCGTFFFVWFNFHHKYHEVSTWNRSVLIELYRHKINATFYSKFGLFAVVMICIEMVTNNTNVSSGKFLRAIFFRLERHFSHLLSWFGAHIYSVEHVNTVNINRFNGISNDQFFADRLLDRARAPDIQFAVLIAFWPSLRCDAEISYPLRLVSIECV